MKQKLISYEDYERIVQERAQLDIFDYHKIADNIPPFRTMELWHWNEFYGIARILKKYAGYPLDYKIKAAVTHGVLATEYDSAEFHRHLPAIFVPTKWHASHLLHNAPNRNWISLGYWILYATGLLSNEEIIAKKQKLGKSLLVFPSHKVNLFSVDYDKDAFIQKIYELKKSYGFNSVTVCLYWEDILHGDDAFYANAGFNIVCNGHILDNFFFDRLKSVIELHDAMLFNDWTSAIFYALCLNKLCLYFNDNSLIYDESSNDNTELLMKTMKDKLLISEKKYVKNIVEIKRDMLKEYDNPSSFRSPKELRLIFENTEKLYEDMLKKGEPTAKYNQEKAAYLNYGIHNEKKVEYEVEL